MINLLLFLLSIAQAFDLARPYQSGAMLCQNLDQEYHRWVSVRSYPDEQVHKRTQVYAFTTKPFNPNWPTVLFVSGGPGVSARSTLFDLPNINVLFFEQRGISCSRPDDEEDFLNPKFYSSLNTARDMEKILDAFKINRATIYAHSYGTIPATIFAHLYPHRVNRLILEGVIAQADQSLWNSNRKKNLLQFFFNQLPHSTQDRIIDLSRETLPANWFSKLGNMVLYLDQGLEAYQVMLDSILNFEEEQLKNFVLNFYAKNQTEEVFSFGDVTMGMIACREISMNDPKMSSTMIFNSQRELVYDQVNTDRDHYCRPLGLENNQGPFYRAENYPVYVPVFYFLGENDGATDFDQGLLHYNNVAQSQKVILKKTNGGHLPNLGPLKDFRACDDNSEDCSGLRESRLQVQLFSQLIEEGVINQELLHALNRHFETKTWSIFSDE